MATFTKEYIQAVEEKADRWVPACGGLEQPFTMADGTRYLYVFNPALREHALLNLTTDTIVRDSAAHQDAATEAEENRKKLEFEQNA